MKIFFKIEFSSAFINGVGPQPVQDTPVIDPMTGQAIFPSNIPDPIPEPTGILNRNASKGSLGNGESRPPITQPPKPALKKTIR